MTIKLPKVFKVKKTLVKEQDNLCIRYKNLSKQQLKDFKTDIDQFCQAYFAVEEKQ
jgi:hypothetical protein